LTVPNFREYFYKKIQFSSTPGSARAVNQLIHGVVDHAGSRERTHARSLFLKKQQPQLQQQHANIMHGAASHAGSCMPVHPVRTEQHQEQ
jgi:hypothetical protein